MIIIDHRPVAQGDLLIRRIDSLPTEVKAHNVEEAGYHVLAHSETGHHHAVKAQPGITYYQHANDNLVAYLVVNNPPQEVELEHMRSFDTHESYRMPNGVYELRRQIEGGLEGFKIVTD